VKLLNVLNTAMLLCLMLVIAFERGQSGDPTQLAQAEARYVEGMELLDTDDDAARVKFRESAAILADANVDSAGLHFNRANALLQAGDLGEAIASYRAAQLRAPSDDRIATNLAEARSKVLRPLGVPAPTTLEQACGLWSWLDEQTRLLITLGFAWSLVVALQNRARGTGIACAVLGAIVAATVAADIARRANANLAVVTEPTVIRKGNGDGFEQVVAEPLPIGTECRIVESRPGWIEVELAPPTRGWIKSTTAVEVP
jgi:tetratricopeptide (TPR) repeat protein